MMPPMDALQQLLIHHHCRELVLRAAACADAHDAAGLAALFTAEALLVRPDGTTLEGPAAIEAAYRQRPAERITRHLVTNSLVDIECGRGRAGAQQRAAVVRYRNRAGRAAGPAGRRQATARQLRRPLRADPRGLAHRASPRLVRTAPRRLSRCAGAPAPDRHPRDRRRKRRRAAVRACTPASPSNPPWASKWRCASAWRTAG